MAAKKNDPVGGGRENVSQKASGGVLAETQAQADVGQAIGAKLRKLYTEVSAAPVPDRFADLLKKLESGGKGGPDG